KYGGPHAEIDALRHCANPKGATAYVTLEPCCHHGKTPPCTNALIEAGIRKVVIGCLDPHDKVSGGGLAILKRAGIETQVGLLEEEAKTVVRPFKRLIVDGRPYVIAKWAQSIDGKIATHTGASSWISGEASRRLVHKIRARVDAVMVGYGTVAADNPRLTARDVPIRRYATRVVWDGQLRTRIRDHVASVSATSPTLIFTSPERAESAHAAKLRDRGVEVVACRTTRTGLSVRDGLKKLAGRGMCNVLLEGGAKLTASFMDAQLIDEAHIFVAPVLIGGARAPSAVGGRGWSTLDGARDAQTVTSRRVGEDHLYTVQFGMD
ncbi:MAG: bifunctional diaminohydroxyphosphoribosylaminopyrimidine deaminase/5-amino-6-(5-phosphoribosylamino)uracil reductase RibD, partial [Phycisphaerae bacterium]